jgi:dephospho-CoA kinase
MSPVVVGLAGRRGSGKSTLAATLHSQYGFARVSFGDYVRSIARERTLPGDVATLEELGRKLIAELGWDRFCAAVLGGAESSERLVVDGVRHVAAATTLRSLIAPGHFGLTLVEIDDAVRMQRVAARARPGETVEDIEMSNELEQLRRGADLVVDGARNDGAERIVAWVESVSAENA